MLPVKTTLLPTVSRFFDDDWNNLFDWSKNNLATQSHSLPPVNIQEKSDHILIELAVPGRKKADFQIKIHNSTLSIMHLAEDPNQVPSKNYTRKEFSFYAFERSFNINHNIVDDQKIEAYYEDGILKLILFKKEEAKEKPSRTIQIK